MKTKLVFLFLLYCLKHKVTNATMWPTQRYTEKDVYLQGFTLESSKVENIFECYTKCENNILCTSINMNLRDKTCELKNSTKSRDPEKIVNRPNTIYMEIRGDSGTPGSDKPISSCKKLKENDSQAKSGIYWMKFNDPNSKPFQVFCDMSIDGGGWTLVYSYTFTKFNEFNSVLNDVSPIPNWPVDKINSGTWAPESTNIPLSESAYSAMDFALWKKIGNEFLIKSNITNWVACVEGTGSLVKFGRGSLTCRVVKAITPTCTTVTPNQLLISWGCGPGLYLSDDDDEYIYLEGNSDRCVPVHDPCGTKSTVNHLTNVTNPGGAIYIR